MKNLFSMLFMLVVFVATAQPAVVLEEGYIYLSDVGDDAPDEWIYVPEEDMYMKEYSLTGVGVFEAVVDFLDIVEDHVESLDDYDMNRMLLPSYLSSTDLIEDPNSVATALRVGSAKIQLGETIDGWSYLLFMTDEQVNIAIIDSSKTSW